MNNLKVKTDFGWSRGQNSVLHPYFIMQKALGGKKILAQIIGCL